MIIEKNKIQQSFEQKGSTAYQQGVSDVLDYIFSNYQIFNHNLPILQEGDHFLRYSKYGGYIIGKVDKIQRKNTIIILDNCNIAKLEVISTNNVTYDYEECIKITRLLTTEQELEKRQVLIQRLGEKGDLKEERSFSEYIKRQQIMTKEFTDGKK